jgi:hypothetical protein
VREVSEESESCVSAAVPLCPERVPYVLFRPFKNFNRGKKKIGREGEATIHSQAK